eukprot:757258-Hanusia_phi.AAC.1
MDGSSKESVGEELAKKLGYKYFSTNGIISELLKMPIEKAFDQLGEEEFLKIERAVLDQLQAYYGAVISTGSCAALQSENWAKFRTVKAETLENVGLQKPLKSEEAVFLDKDEGGLLDALMSQRSSFYEQVDISRAAGARLMGHRRMQLPSSTAWMEWMGKSLKVMGRRYEVERT